MVIDAIISLIENIRVLKNKRPLVIGGKKSGGMRIRRDKFGQKTGQILKDRGFPCCVPPDQSRNIVDLLALIPEILWDGHRGRLIRKFTIFVNGKVPIS